MKTTLSLRAILYENVTFIFENVTDFMDDQFLHSVFCYFYDERFTRQSRATILAPRKEQAKKEEEKEKPLKGIMKQPNKGDTRRSEVIGGIEINLDMNYMGNERNVKALQDWNWVNEEALTKLKIVAMGKILE